MKLPEPGERFAEKYGIEAILGEGGFGRVYLAQTDGTGRRVAIKVLKPSGDSTAHVKVRRFLRELKTIAQLTHPNTMTLYDYGRTPDGLFYMVCEYVAGEDLSELLARRGRLTESETIHVLLQALESLREAHQMGVLHRDIKPDNLRLTAYRDDALVVKVLDFGIAKSLAGDQPNLTATGKVIGTPRYMSPEQLTGIPLTEASDIFSLGLVAYEMLLGPTAGTLRGVSIVAPIAIAASDGVGEPLRLVVNRMLEVDTNRRFATADQVVRALRTLDSSGVRSRPPAPQPRPPSPSPVPQERDEKFPTAVRQARSWALRAAVVGVMCGIVLTLVVFLFRVPIEAERPAPAIATGRSTSLIKAPRRSDAGLTPVDAEAPGGPADARVTTEDARRPRRGAGCGPQRISPGRAEDGLYGARLPEGDLAFHHPPDYDNTRPYPIVVLLHAIAETEVRLFHDSGFRRVAEEHGFVVISPRHLAIPPWRRGGGGVELIAASIDYVADRLCVDRERIYVFGLANGAALARDLPCSMSGIQAIATAAYRETHDVSCERKVPLIQFTGLKDGYFPPEGGRACNGERVPSLSDSDDAMRARHVCSEERSIFVQEKAHRCWTWDCEVPFVSCHLDGGRGFPGQRRSRALDMILNCDGTPPDIDIAETAWQFFAQTDAQTDAQTSGASPAIAPD